jgi:hypothetical protein
MFDLIQLVNETISQGYTVFEDGTVVLSDVRDPFLRMIWSVVNSLPDELRFRLLGDYHWYN